MATGWTFTERVAPWQAAWSTIGFGGCIWSTIARADRFVDYRLLDLTVNLARSLLFHCLEA